jgi:tRNA(Arg) A34 adenosine deaminase TadA
MRSICPKSTDTALWWCLARAKVECEQRERVVHAVTGADRNHLQRAIELARRARANGNHPFGALLVDAAGTVVAEAENTVVTEGDPTGHAELNLVRGAGRDFGPERLVGGTIYSSTEPCAMCAGAIYWAGLGHVVYALAEDELRRLTGDHAANPTLALPIREVLARGQRTVSVEGPALADEARAVHEGFWS